MKPFVLIFLLCFSIQVGLAAAAEPANQNGGNRQLMDEWVSKKMLVKKKILDKLRKEDKLPRNGTIEYEARVAPNPRDRNEIEIHVDKIELITPKGTISQVSTGKVQTEETDLSFIFKPMTVSRTEAFNMTFTGGEVIRDRIELGDITLKKGAAEGSQAVSPEMPAQNEKTMTNSQPPEAPPKKPEEKSWWQRLFGS